MSQMEHIMKPIAIGLHDVVREGITNEHIMKPIAIGLHDVVREGITNEHIIPL